LATQDSHPGSGAQVNGSAALPDYEKIFHPGRIAIVGVSGEGSGFSFGNGVLQAMQAIGYEGEILPVNPKGGSFAGLNIFKSIEEIPGEIDFAIIAVGARLVPQALEACRGKGAAGAEVISSGFSELGTPGGISLEEEIRRVAAKGIRVIGPNCFGIYCPKSGLTFMPGPDLSRESGPVAFVSQSGGMAIDFANTGKWMGLRFSKVVSFGNGADLRETDFLQYFGDDPETRVISMYVEGINSGEGFFQALKQATAKKPVIVYKGGLSEAGQRAVVSHTASMGGSRMIWPAVLKQVNAVQVEDMQEMAQASLAFSFLPERQFKNVAVLGGGGALGVAACDAAESYGIGIPPFPPDLKAQIENFLPRPGSSAANPVDIANPYVPAKNLKEVLLLGAKDENIDLQIMISLLYHFKALAKSMGKPVARVTPFAELADAAGSAARETGKPVIVVLPNPRRGLDDMDIVEMQEQARQMFLARGVPVFDEIRDVFRALGHVNTYYANKGFHHE
jgi:acyl-CoA synthetase (NDP forming)